MKPTFMLFLVITVLLVAAKWAYDKGTNQPFTI